MLEAHGFGGRAMSALLPLTQLRRFSLTDVALSDAMLAPLLSSCDSGSSGTGTGREGVQQQEEEEEEEAEDEPERLLQGLTYLSVQGLRLLE